MLYFINLFNNVLLYLIVDLDQKADQTPEIKEDPGEEAQAPAIPDLNPEAILKTEKTNPKTESNLNLFLFIYFNY